MTSRPRSTRLKATLDTTLPGIKSVRLSNDQVDALIAQLKEIAEANVDLIAEAEATRAESVLVRARAVRLQWVVSVAFALGCFIAVAIYSNVKTGGEFVREEILQSRNDFRLLDKNVTLTLEVVRALSDAQAAKVQADVDMTTKSEGNAQRKAVAAQRFALEAETKIQKDPAKKAKAVKRLKAAIKDDELR